MNASVILTRGTHSGGKVDMHIKMHTSIRTNIFTTIILFMGMENVFVHMPYVRSDLEALWVYKLYHGSGPTRKRVPLDDVCGV